MIIREQDRKPERQREEEKQREEEERSSPYAWEQRS
jgi:hypothetical protein